MVKFIVTKKYFEYGLHVYNFEIASDINNIIRDKDLFVRPRLSSEFLFGPASFDLSLLPLRQGRS